MRLPPTTTAFNSKIVFNKSLNIFFLRSFYYTNSIHLIKLHLEIRLILYKYNNFVFAFLLYAFGIMFDFFILYLFSFLYYSYILQLYNKNVNTSCVLSLQFVTIISNFNIYLDYK